MKSAKKLTIKNSVTLREAIETIDKVGVQLAIVVDPDDKLIGVLTDGDVRRAILKGHQLSDPITSIVNYNPVTISDNSSQSDMLMLLRSKNLHHLIVVDDSKRVVEVVLLDELVGMCQQDHTVILMAGGIGSRLMPLTTKRPKPMLHVSNKPILEAVLQNFIEQGFCNFIVSVNYLRDIIKSYFGDGSRFGVRIQYLEESQRLGTAGALSLLPERPKKPFIVMNGDILTRMEFKPFVKFHYMQHSIASLVVRSYDFQIPYGVVETAGNFVSTISEKPTYSFAINAGIYMLNPEVLDFIPSNTFFDMTTLFSNLLNYSKTISSFETKEYWLDVSRHIDYERAQVEWN